ncbi:hypothetical protein AGDE_13844 [Angomonas deanei]|uniref:Uncharacterized protein n=1 Tax=Angomonas deanei TaxID=59799 RepID=A0A7G2CNJ5_9TRYP|nr:hypothetical protein AGDE_13844 [Angomonas deanei]CAD2220524.1 hypothetical protein, conserved [Angomonas deanei]|eukprot:EPY21709.1 hypothetical protein AGDE_13844 [Angomonas deanei]
MILFEFLVSILLCTVIGYFFFLSGPADEEDNPNHDHATVSKFPFNLLDPNYWKSLCLPYVNQDTTLGFVLRTVLFFVTDDEAFGYDMYTGHEEVGRVSSDVYEEGRVVPRDVKRRRGHPHLEKGAKFAGVERRHAESANWVNTLLRLCAYLFLGGGSFLHEVYVDRVRYGAEKCIRKVNSRFDVHPPPPQNPDAGGWTSTKAMCMKKCLLQLLHLEMGKGFNLPNANNDGEGNSFMNAQGNDFPLPLNVEGDVMTASSRSTTALEDGYTNNNNNSSSQFGINFPRLAGDIISVEILPGAVGDLVPHSATTPLAPIAAASNASKRSRTTKIATVSSTTSPLLPSEKVDGAGDPHHPSAAVFHHSTALRGQSVLPPAGL